MPARIQFRETLRLCKASDLVADGDSAELEKLVELRNPLMHFRDISDGSNLTRRTLMAGKSSEEVLYGDASVAIGIVIKMLSKPPFRVG
jgi:hypothetical protein